MSHNNDFIAFCLSTVTKGVNACLAEVLSRTVLMTAEAVKHCLLMCSYAQGFITSFQAIELLNTSEFSCLFFPYIYFICHVLFIVRAFIHVCICSMYSSQAQVTQRKLTGNFSITKSKTRPENICFFLYCF